MAPASADQAAESLEERRVRHQQLGGLRARTGLLSARSRRGLSRGWAGGRRLASTPTWQPASPVGTTPGSGGCAWSRNNTERRSFDRLVATCEAYPILAPPVPLAQSQPRARASARP